MPRKSAEERSAAYYRTGGNPPEAPKHLDRQSKALWQQIVNSRPPDFFQPGALHLLEAFVEAIVMHRFYMSMWKRHQDNGDYLKAVVALNNSLSQLATKLRLSISSIDKRSGILTERESEGSADNVTLLFGGGGPLKF